MPKLPTGIDRLPSGRYRVRVNVHHRRITRTAPTLAAARQIRTRLEIDVPAAAGTVAEMMTAWSARKRTTVGDSTMVDYQSVIDRHILPAFAERQVASIRPIDIDTLYGRLLTRGLSPARVRRVHQVLAQAFKAAARWGDIPSSPVASVDPPTITPHEIEPPTPADVAELIAAADPIHPGMAAYLRLAVVTGARRGEMVALRGDDLNLDTGELLIRRALTRAHPDPALQRGRPIEGMSGIVEKDTKTHAARRLALDQATVNVMRRHRRRLAERAISCGIGLDLEQHRWFTDDPAGVIPWRPNQVNRWWEQTRARCGLDHVRLHDLRHFSATQALAAGVDVRTVAGRLGHSRASMTLDRYSHVVPAADRAAADILGDIVTG